MLVLIPARGQSKRIPRKNIRLLGGKPLIQYSIEAAQQLPVRDVVVSTEDAEIARVAKSLGATVLMRPEELASDDATDHDVVNHFLLNYDCERIVYLRPTTPFRGVGVLREAISTDFRGTSLRSVHEMPESAFKCFEFILPPFLHPIPNGKSILSDLPNHRCPKTYSGNGYVDIILPKCLSFDTSNVFGNVIYGYLTPPTIELDTPEQWAYAEYLIEKGLI